MLVIRFVEEVVSEVTIAKRSETEAKRCESTLCAFEPRLTLCIWTGSSLKASLLLHRVSCVWLGAGVAAKQNKALLEGLDVLGAGAAVAFDWLQVTFAVLLVVISKGASPDSVELPERSVFVRHLEKLVNIRSLHLEVILDHVAGLLVLLSS